MQFYIYEHWRPDKNECFYVGKGKRYKGKVAFGKPYRAYEMRNSRNRHHKAIVDKLSVLGLYPDVRIIFETNNEYDAFAKEIERIAFWRNHGINLANLADGGGKNSGFKRSDEQIEGMRQRMLGKQYRLGAILSDETKKKISKAHQGMTYSEQYKSAMAIACAGEKNGFYGKTHSEATRSKVAGANRRRVWSVESRNKIGDSQRGRQHKPHSEETRRKMRISSRMRWDRAKAEKNAARST